MKVLRATCHRGHPYVENSFRWKSDGARSCNECERIRRELNHDHIVEMQAHRRQVIKDRRAEEKQRIEANRAHVALASVGWDYFMRDGRRKRWIVRVRA